MRQILPRLLLVFLLGCLPFFANAQCTPDPSITQPGLYPRNLPDGSVSVSYNQVLQFKFPTDTTYMGAKVPIDSAHIESVSGLPSSFTYQTNKASRMYKGGETGCVRLSGTPSTSGNYKVTVNVLAYMHYGGANFQAPFSDTLSLKVTSNTGFSSQPRPMQYTFDVEQNYPNPFSRTTMINYSSPSNENVIFRVYDLMGNEVYSVEKTAQKGENNILFERNRLSPGIYFYSIQLGTKTLTRRMIVSN